MADINQKLALGIFSKNLHELTLPELDFIDYQAREYNGYRKRAARRLRHAEQKKKLTTLEYEMIEYLFFQRVHILDVIVGIDNGILLARELGKPVYSAGFFKPHIYVLYQKRKKEIDSKIHKAIPDLDYPWFYLFYSMDRSGELREWAGKRAVFDPYYGFVLE